MRAEQLAQLGLSEDQIQGVLSLGSQERQLMESRMEAMRRRYDEDAAALRLEGAVERALWQCGAKNVRAVRGMIDTATLRLEADGVVSGLEEQLRRLRQSDGYLFGDKGGLRVSTGGNHGSGLGPDYNQMTDAEYYTAKLGS